MFPGLAVNVSGRGRSGDGQQLAVQTLQVPAGDIRVPRIPGCTRTHVGPGRNLTPLPVMTHKMRLYDDGFPI